MRRQILSLLLRGAIATRQPPKSASIKEVAASLSLLAMTNRGNDHLKRAATPAVIMRTAGPWWRQVAPRSTDGYLDGMSDTPAFLDSGRPPVPDLVVPRGVLPFFLPRRPVRGRLIRPGPLADALLTRHD